MPEVFRICSVIFVLFLVYHNILAKDVEHLELPDLFKIEQCSPGFHICELRYKIGPKNHTDPVLWNKLQITENDRDRYDRTRPSRVYCVPNSIRGDEKKTEEFLIKTANEEMDKFRLELEFIEHILCRTVDMQLGLYELIFGLGLLLYAGFIVFATKYDYDIRRKQSDVAYKGNKYVLAFSLKSNFEIFLKPNTSELYNKLKCMQGVRTCCMCAVILGHAALNFAIGYTENWEYLEKCMKNNIQVLMSAGMFVVQPFFLVTGILLTVYMEKHMEMHKKLRFKDVVLGIINRILRLWPVMIFMVLMHRTKFPSKVIDGSLSVLFECDYTACVNNWMATIFFYSNLVVPQHTCNITTWYLSADMQLFIFSMMVLYIIYKFKLPKYKTLLVFLVLDIIAKAGWLYSIGADQIIFSTKPDNLLFHNLLLKNKFVDAWYLHTMAQAPTYIVGLMFGLFFYETKDKKFVPTKLQHVAWFIISFGLPFFCVYFSSLNFQQSNKVLVAFLAASIKAIYAVGFGVGILGMAHNMGGIVKKLFECRPVELVSSLTYCIYLFHIVVVLMPSGSAKTLVTFDVPYIFALFFIDVPICILFGAGPYFMVELPWSNVQSLLLKGSRERSKKQN